MGDSPAPNRDGRASTLRAPSGRGNGTSDTILLMLWNEGECPYLATSDAQGMLGADMQHQLRGCGPLRNRINKACIAFGEVADGAGGPLGPSIA
eukprot:7823116-Alexandrium_andersonii.AAC.1